MNAELKDLWAMSHDGDAWEQCMSFWFAISGAMYRNDLAIPAHWDYRPGFGEGDDPLPEEWPDSEIQSLINSETLTLTELAYAGNVFCRLAGICKAQGLDY